VAVSRAKKFKGYWWLPENPDCQWFGNVRWRPGESPKLKLLYRTGEEATSAPPAKGTESILGLDEGGTPISLLRLGWAGGVNSGFLSERKYSVGHILKGIHVNARDAFRVHRFNLHLQHLGGWLREEGFQSPDPQETGFNVRYSRPPDRSFEIAKGVTVHLCHYARSSARNRARTVSYDIFFAMEKGHSFSWKQAYRSIDALRTFLHFACLRRVKSTGVTFENLDHTFSIGQQRYPKTIDAFNAGIEAPQKENLHEDDFVFMFDDVETRFGKLCRDWLQFCIEQREALACYDCTVYFSLPDGLRLTSITQALEAYHQRFYRPKTDVKFKDRIKELCNIQRQRVEGIIGDIEQFATVVTDSRDYYTHHHPSIRNRGTVVTGVKLTMVSYHLQFLFRLCVLSQFGLERDTFGLLLRQIPGRIVEY
jgi:hypothetical protein